MHRTLLGSFVVVLWAGTSLFGWTEVRQQPATASAPPTALTGCLRSNNVGTTPATTQTVFTLEPTAKAGEGQPATDKPSTESAADASPSDSAAASKKAVYSLSAAESIDLAKHVDHKVELTGRMPPVHKPTATAGSPTDAAEKPGGAHNTFQVTALKMISAKCP